MTSRVIKSNSEEILETIFIQLWVYNSKLWEKKSQNIFYEAKSTNNLIIVLYKVDLNQVIKFS